MNKRELLEDAIRKINLNAGFDPTGAFHLTPLSMDGGGAFVMAIMWPEGRRVCEEIRRVVNGFPPNHSSCIALLPNLVEEIIAAARSNRPDSPSRLRRRTSAGSLWEALYARQGANPPSP